MTKKIILIIALMAVNLTVYAQESYAAKIDPSSCEKVRFATIGWSDIDATNAVSTFVLDALGYKTEIVSMQLENTFSALKEKKLDVFLGYWSPTQDTMIQPFREEGSLKVLDKPNLEKARYTLAVPSYLYEQGLKSFSDIARYSKELSGSIHGIEPGNDGNILIKKIVATNQFGLKEFKLVESSETGMMDSVHAAYNAKKPILFLGWEPHPMNLRYSLKYLGGGDEVFGPNFGASKVYTVIASDLDTRCPNLYGFLKNFRVTVDQENWIMVGTFGSEKKSVGKTWIKAKVYG